MLSRLIVVVFCFNNFLTLPKNRVRPEVATPVCLLLLLVSIIFLTIKKNHSGGHSTLLVSCPPGAG